MEELMKKPWFEKHRPTNMSEVVFQSKAVETKMKQMIDQGYIQGNIISYGPGGVGKTTLNKILLYSIVKDGADVHVLDKSVSKIDELKAFLVCAPVASKQKIVICEEFDQLSSSAQTALKNGLMENFMPGVAFIVTTNNIQSIDPALLQRFNEKLDFELYDIDGCYFRMIDILKKENVTFDEKDLYQTVINFQNKGIRELINNLQSCSIDNVYASSNSTNKFISTSGLEDSLISYIKYFIEVIMAEQDLEVVYNICIEPVKDERINAFYTPMIKYMENDPSVNYEYIYKILLKDDTLIIPVKRVLQKFYQELKLIPMKDIHLLACVFEIFIALYTIKGGEKRLIH